MYVAASLKIHRFPIRGRAVHRSMLTGAHFHFEPTQVLPVRTCPFPSAGGGVSSMSLDFIPPSGLRFARRAGPAHGGNNNPAPPTSLAARLHHTHNRFPQLPALPASWRPRKSTTAGSGSPSKTTCVLRPASACPSPLCLAQCQRWQSPLPRVRPTPCSWRVFATPSPHCQKCSAPPSTEHRGMPPLGTSAPSRYSGARGGSGGTAAPVPGPGPPAQHLGHAVRGQAVLPSRAGPSSGQAPPHSRAHSHRLTNRTLLPRPLCTGPRSASSLPRKRWRKSSSSLRATSRKYCGRKSSPRSWSAATMSRSTGVRCFVRATPRPRAAALAGFCRARAQSRAAPRCSFRAARWNSYSALLTPPHKHTLPLRRLPGGFGEAGAGAGAGRSVRTGDASATRTLLMVVLLARGGDFACDVLQEPPRLANHMRHTLCP